MINLHDFKSAYYKRKWRNWYTRTFEGRVPKGLRVRVPPCAPVFIGGGWFFWFYGSTRFVVIAGSSGSSYLTADGFKNLE